MLSTKASIYLLGLWIWQSCGHNSGCWAAPPAISPFNNTCSTDDEWRSHPMLCQVLQHLEKTRPPAHSNPTATRISTVDNNNNNDDGDDTTMIITSQHLHQFADAMGWIVHLRSGTTSTSTSGSTPPPPPLETEVTVSSSSSTSITTTQMSRRTTTTSTAIPVVIAHGMGDSCYNEGMIQITKLVSTWLQNVYTVCIPIGTTPSEDTNNGFFLNMNDSIDYFAQQIQQDAQLMAAPTFHAIGLSQGNNIIRGYIARYNSILPPVHTFISINGVNAGIGAVPHCIPEQVVRTSRERSDTIDSLSEKVALTLCDLLMEQASAAAYTTFAQKHSFQANYWRDPRPSEYDTYRTYSQLAVLNNEVLDPATQFNDTLRVNWSRTMQFVWIMAQDDRTVWPPLGEQWGAPDPIDPYRRRVLHMNETDWYQQDYFGLRTAQEQGKNYFESFPGDHLQFTKDDLQRWVETYLRC